MEIENLLRVSDMAIADDDADAYRATMEGFYCDWGDGDVGRMGIAQRAVGAYESTDTRLIAAYPAGTKNYPTAVAVTARTDANGAVSEHTIYLERFAVGWRITWSPDWY